MSNSRSANFLGGSQDGGTVAFSNGLPRTLRVDAEAYVLSASHGRMRPRYLAMTTWGRRRRFDAQARRDFLDAYAAGMTVVDAAGACGFSPGPVYVARNRDPEFALAYAAAQRHKRRPTGYEERLANSSASKVPLAGASSL